MKRLPKTTRPERGDACPENDPALQLVSIWDIQYGPPPQQKKRVPQPWRLILVDAMADEVDRDAAPETPTIH